MTPHPHAGTNGRHADEANEHTPPGNNPTPTERKHSTSTTQTHRPRHSDRRPRPTKFTITQLMQTPRTERLTTPKITTHTPNRPPENNNPHPK